MKNRFLAGLLFLTANSFAQLQNCVFLTDIYPGASGSNPALFTEFNGDMYFSCTGNAQGLELWRYNNGSPVMVADINPGFGGSLLNNFTVAGPLLYFSANNGSLGTELWKYDGTTASLAADICPGAGGSSISKMIAVGTTVYFFANDGVTGQEAWKFDGTTLTQIGDLEPGAAGSNPVDLEAFGGSVFMTATTTAYGLELWQYDGTSTFVHDIWPGAQGSDVGELTNIGTQLCLRATDGVLGYEVWMHDGTSLTCLDINPGADHFTPWDLTAMGGDLYCRGFFPGSGYELWTYDGTSATMIMDINPGPGGSAPNNLTVANGTHLYFAAHNGSLGNELWLYDGTTCALAADIRTGVGNSMPVFYIEKMATLGEDVFMVAASNTSGYEVWRYDGASAILSKDIVVGSGSSSATGLKAFGNTMFWSGNDAVNGGELWAWDIYADLDDTISVITCGNYISPAGDTYNVPGLYNFTDTVPSVHCPGCDSLVNVALEITQPESSITVLACNDYTSPSGAFYDTEGTYTIVDVIPSVTCAPADSVITIDLTIVDDISNAVIVFAGVLVAQQSGAGYQWLDCSNGYAPVPGATDQDFLPTVDGTYACEITFGTCSDTSNCFFVEAGPGDIGFDEQEAKFVSVFPNPVSGILTVALQNETGASITIADNLGNVVRNHSFDSATTELDLSDLPAGIYFIHVLAEGNVYVQKLIKL